MGIKPFVCHCYVIRTHFLSYEVLIQLVYVQVVTTVA
jgi:hypothetical protein